MLNIATVISLIKQYGGADPDVIEAKVQDWLDAHPEATTTVQDGSITEQKLATSIAQKLGLISSLSDEIAPLIDKSRPAINGLSGYTRYGAVADYDSKWWGNATMTFRMHVVVPIPSGTNILTITAAQEHCLISALVSEPTEIVNGESVGTFSSYWTHPVRIEPGETLNAIIPPDVKNLIVNVVYGSVECVESFQMKNIEYGEVGKTSEKANNLIHLNIGAHNVRDFGDGSGDGCPDNLVLEKMPLWKQLISSQLNCDFLCITEWFPFFDRSKTIDTYDAIFKQFYPYKMELPAINPTRIILSKHPGVLTNIALYADVKFNIPSIICNIGGKTVCVACWVQSSTDTVATRQSAYTAAVGYLAQFDIAILAGDFNTEVGLDELSVFTDAGYILGNGGYWGIINTYPAGNPTTPNDNIVSRGAIFEKFDVIENYITSDHRPVLGSFSFNA